MFETVVPELTGEKNHRWLMAETLPLSVAIHAAASGLVVVAALTRTIFPVQPPRLARAYVLTTLAELPAVPPPPPPAAPAPRRLENTPATMEMFAPTIIPDSIVPLTPEPEPAAVDQPGGVEGGIGIAQSGPAAGGTVGGIVTDSPPGPPDDGRVHIERNKALPVKIFERPFPRYPDKLRLAHKEGQVTIRYIIDIEGRVRDVILLDPDPEPLFNEATLEALRKWRFEPMIKEGKKVEVVHELTVLFELINR